MQMMHFMAKFALLPQILEQKTVFHHDYDCSMQMSLKAYVYAKSAWKK